MAINIFLNRVNKDEFIEILKVVIFLVYRKTPLTEDIIQFINHLAKFYHFNDNELESLFTLDTRDSLNIEDTITNLSKPSSKMLLLFLTLFAEIFDEIDLEDIYDKEKLFKQLPISPKMQKNIIETTKEYIDKTIVMHYFIYNKKIPFYQEFANALNLMDISKHKNRHFFIIDLHKINSLKKTEKIEFIYTLKELMLDDKMVSQLEKEALKLWALYLNLNYKKIENNNYSIVKQPKIKKLWLKNFLLFSYLLTQKNLDKSLANAKKVLSITDKEAQSLIKNVKIYTSCVKKLYSLIFSQNLTYQNETKAKNMNHTLHLGELALLALPQTKIFNAIKIFNATRKAIGTPLELNNKSEVGIKKLQKRDSNKLIIAIDGFLSEGEKEQFNDWMKTLKKYYSDSTIVGFKWKSQNLKVVMNGGISTWYKAVHQTLDSAKKLSNYIIEQKELNSNLEITLMGHSLGARVIFNTLFQLLNSKTKVDNIILLGGAANNDKVNWSDVSHAVSKNIYNFYSKKDMVLKNLYQLTMLDTPIGLSKIKIFKIKELKSVKIHNINVSSIITGHNEYKPKLEELLTRYDI